jgi:hypothetical protein
MVRLHFYENLIENNRLQTESFNDEDLARPHYMENGLCYF